MITLQWRESETDLRYDGAGRGAQLAITSDQEHNARAPESDLPVGLHP
jgi:hypothetical protein